MFTQWFKGGNAIAAPPTGIVMTIGAAPCTGAYAQYGTCYGYTSDPHYLGMGDSGSITYKYLRDVRVPASPAIVRIADITYQQANYLIFGWEPIAGTPDPSWPQFTTKMKINGGTIYDFGANGSTPSISAPCTGKYITVTGLPWDAAHVGNTVNISFV